MTLPSVELSAAYQACLNEAIRQSPLIIESWSVDLANLLQHKAMETLIPSEKTALRNAVVALKTDQHELARRFVRELSQAIAGDGKSGTVQKAVGSRSLASVSFDDLELMGDNQVQETLDGARLQQTVSQASEFELAGFSARLSTAQGFQKVQADKNPLRPEVIAGALLKAFRQSHIDHALQSRLLVHGALLLGGQLQSLYVALNGLLAGYGVAPAAYGVVTAATGRNRDATNAAGIDSVGSNQPIEAATARPAEPGPAQHAKPRGFLPGAAGEAGVSHEQLLTLDRLHRLMAGEYNDSFVPQAPTVSAGPDFDDLPRNDFSHTVPAAMDMLKDLKQQGLALGQQKTGWATPPAPVALIREHLKTDAKSLGQSVAIEVVGLMIEQLTQDNRLLAPVKQIIANAEPAFLRLAVSDPRFFNDKSHPARRLLDVITTKSLAYSSEEAHGFAGFMLDLHMMAELLTEEHASDAQHFAALLQDFEQRQLVRSRAADAARERAVAALLRVEERNVLAGKIAAEIRLRPDFDTSNPVVAAFLMEPWSQVMAKEWLSDQARGAHADTAVFSAALDDLLASVNAVDVSDAAQHREWLAATVPRLVETLRQGLLSIDYPLSSASELFKQLERVHRSALSVPEAGSTRGAGGINRSGTRKAVSPDAHVAALAVAKTRRETLDEAFAAGDSAESYHWLEPSEALQSGFMDSGAASRTGAASSASGHTDFQQTQPYGGDADERRVTGPADPAEADVAAHAEIPLKVGDWVELLSDMRWLRAQLSWISPQNTLFMFTSETGRSHSMTSRVLAHLLKLNLVKVVSQHNVLDGALNSVAATAIRNSVEGPASW